MEKENSKSKNIFSSNIKYPTLTKLIKTIFIFILINILIIFFELFVFHQDFREQFRDILFRYSQGTKELIVEIFVISLISAIIMSILNLLLLDNIIRIINLKLIKLTIKIFFNTILLLLFFLAIHKFASDISFCYCF